MTREVESLYQDRAENAKCAFWGGFRDEDWDLGYSLVRTANSSRDKFRVRMERRNLAKVLRPKPLHEIVRVAKIFATHEFVLNDHLSQIGFCVQLFPACVFQVIGSQRQEVILIRRFDWPAFLRALGNLPDKSPQYKPRRQRSQRPFPKSRDSTAVTFAPILKRTFTAPIITQFDTFSRTEFLTAF